MQYIDIRRKIYPNPEGESYNKKIVRSGDIVEVFEYEIPVRTGNFKEHKENLLGRAGKASEANQMLNRYTVQKRAKKTLRRLVNANVGQYQDARGRPYLPKFYTLTFAENITCLDDSNYEWKKFIQRLNYHIGYKSKYVVVVEFQDRGAVHFHAIFFNLPYIPFLKVLLPLWGQGRRMRVNAIKEVDNVGAYVSKYMGKDLEDDKLVGEKCYFSSRGLLQPIETTEKSQVESVLSALPDGFKTYETSFNNDYTGEIKYRQYNLKDMAYTYVNRRTQEG